MTDFQILMFVIAIALFVIAALLAILPTLRRKGVDVEGIIAEAKNVTATASNIVERVTPFIDNAKVNDVTEKVIYYAHIGTGMAEQLYKAGKLDKDERNKAATDFIYDTLTLAGVERTPEIERLTEGAIEACVYALPKMSTELLTAEVETAIEIEEDADNG